MLRLLSSSSALLFPSPWGGALNSCCNSSSSSSSSSNRSRRMFAIRSRGFDKEEEEESPYEIDRKKALEALQQLDEQLDTLSQQPQAKPKDNMPSSSSSFLPDVPDYDFDRDMFMDMREEAPEISESFLAYTAGALVLLTIFNNVMFNVFIKPAVDGQEQVSVFDRIPLIEPIERVLPQLTE